MAPDKALYGRRCRTPLCWIQVGEKSIFGPKIIQETTERIKLIHDKMKKAHDPYKGCVDQRRRSLEFEEGDHVFLKVKPRLKLKGPSSEGS